MTPFNRSFATVALVALAGFVSTSQNTFAADATNAPVQSGLVHYESLPTGNSCVIEGTAPAHDWTMKSSIISGSMDALEGFPECVFTNAAGAKPAVVIRIPVRSIKSDKASMDTRMQGCMDAAKHPNIEYRLIELKPKSPAGTKGAIQFDAIGALTIYGKTLTNSMPVTIEKKDGKMRVIGTSSVKMSDHNIPPCTFSLLGVSLIKVGDEIKIKFDWLSAPKARPQG